MMRHVIYAVLDLARSPCGNTDPGFHPGYKRSPMQRDVTYVNMVTYGASQMESAPWGF
jgi:hypothetical protein